MKRKKLLGMLAIMAVLGLAAGCSSAGKAVAGDPVEAGPDETLITIERKTGMVGGAAKLAIFIDGREVMQIANNTVRTLVVPNGLHTIAGSYGTAQWHLKTKIPMSFQADSTPLSFYVAHKPDPLGAGGGDVFFERK